MRFKIDLVSYPTVFALFYFVFVGNFKVEAPKGPIYSDGRFNRRFFALRVLAGGLYLEEHICGEAFFPNFTVSNINILIGEKYCLNFRLQRSVKFGNDTEENEMIFFSWSLKLWARGKVIFWKKNCCWWHTSLALASPFTCWS